MEPRPVPSAPPPAVIGDNTHTNGANDDDECVKTFPPAPDLERPPPFAPPPDLPPPPYEELPSL